jgi:hypothetical protein
MQSALDRSLRLVASIRGELSRVWSRALGKIQAGPRPSSMPAQLAYQNMSDGLTLFAGSFSTFGDVVLAQALSHATAVVSSAP